MDKDNRNDSQYYDKFKWAFTEKALSALDMMTRVAGIDKDLAVFMLEQKWTEAEIYHIPKDPKDSA